MYGMQIEQELRKLRSGALRVPELLGSLPTSRQELAAVIQETSSALANLTSQWDQHVRNQGTPDASASAEQSSLAASSDSSPLDAFEAAVTSHMISAAAAAFQEHGPNRPMAFVADPDGGHHAAVLSSIVDSVRKVAPGVQLVLCSSNGGLNVPPKEACEVKLCYLDVFCASVGLAGPGRPEVLRVVVDSFDKAHEMDAWGHTSHQVFRRVSSLAMRALAYFQKRASCWHSEQGMDPGASPPTRAAAAGEAQQPGSTESSRLDGTGSGSLHGCVLHDLLLWLTAFRDLFTRPCCVSGKLLAWDSSTQFPTPPVYRNFKCSRRQLINMALDPNSIQAYHMHVVPEEMLDWCALPGDLHC